MPSDVSPTRSARYDRTTIVQQLVDHLPDQVDAALAGDGEALVTLMLVAADVGWQHRAHDPRQVESVPVTAWLLAEAIADCYASDTPPSDRLTEEAFELAERVDALALEVVLRRAESGRTDFVQLPRTGNSEVSSLRYQARAHLVALRNSAAGRRTIVPPDVAAAQNLYDSLVRLECRIRLNDVERAVEADVAERRGPPEGEPE